MSTSATSAAAAASSRRRSPTTATWTCCGRSRVYKEVGYDGMVMPDHAPRIEGDAGAALAFAFAFGYIKGLIQTVYSEEG